MCTIKLNNYTKRRKYYQNADFYRMRIEFSKIDWKTKFKDSNTNVNRQWEILNTELEILEEKYVPQIEISNHRKGNVPLYVKTRKLIRHKNTFWTRYIETRDGKKYLEHCKIREKIRALTRQLRKEFGRNFANQTKKNPKPFWQYYKSKITIKPEIGKLNLDAGTFKNNLAPIT